MHLFMKNLSLFSINEHVFQFFNGKEILEKENRFLLLNTPLVFHMQKNIVFK